MPQIMVELRTKKESDIRKLPDCGSMMKVLSPNPTLITALELYNAKYHVEKDTIVVVLALVYTDGKLQEWGVYWYGRTSLFNWLVRMAHNQGWYTLLTSESPLSSNKSWRPAVRA